tara:strand:+ start:103 stop:354 length:252 start_codon:yes stop_codon:yes gene_type:complete
MNVSDKLKETKERAADKIFANLLHVENEINDCKENIVNKKLAKVGITAKMHESVLSGLYDQKQVWLYLKSLVAKDHEYINYLK